MGVVEGFFEAIYQLVRTESRGFSRLKSMLVLEANTSLNILPDAGESGDYV